MLFQQLYRYGRYHDCWKGAGVQPLGRCFSKFTIFELYDHLAFAWVSAMVFPFQSHRHLVQAKKWNCGAYVANSTWLCFSVNRITHISRQKYAGCLKTPGVIFLNMSYLHTLLLIIFLGIPSTFLYNFLGRYESIRFQTLHDVLILSLL